MASNRHIDLLLDIALQHLSPELRRHEVHEISELALEEASDCLRVVTDVGATHELEFGDLDQLPEANHEPPRVRTAGL